VSLQEIPDRPSRLVDVVHRHLQVAILSGVPAPGEQLSVPELARQLGVGRGSVREAVLQLVAEGLAEERPHRGVVVATIGPDEVRQIHEIREALEGQAARLCATSPHPELVKQLEAALAEQHQAIDAANSAAYAETDSHFHGLLAASCGNPMLGSFIERLHAQMQLALDRVAETPEHRTRGQAELRTVLDAIRAADPDGAEAAMRAHIRRTRGEIASHEKDDK
jgi:DNA-binding GntR family transcriptional regulator